MGPGRTVVAVYLDGCSESVSHALEKAGIRPLLFDFKQLRIDSRPSLLEDASRT